MHENKDIAPNSIAPNPLGLTPILLFVILVVVTGITTNDITAMPILVAFFISAGYGLCLNPKGKKVSFSEKVQTFCKGGGDKNIILLVLIFFQSKKNLLYLVFALFYLNLAPEIRDLT